MHRGCSLEARPRLNIESKVRRSERETWNDWRKIVQHINELTSDLQDDDGDHHCLIEVSHLPLQDRQADVLDPRVTSFDR